MDLKDKVVIVTGASDGIGAETAKLFAQEGCNVVVCYNSQKGKAEEVFKECSKFKESMLVHLDVKDEEEIKEVVSSVAEMFGAIDILVNNAGTVEVKDLVETSWEKIDEQIDVNLTGVVKMTKAVLPYFQGQEDGIVINISSILGKEASREAAIYSATKAGVIRFTEAMAEEFRKDKIRFYCVSPRDTATKMNEFIGVHPKKVGELIVNVAKEILGKKSGDDVDVGDYVKEN